MEINHSNLQNQPLKTGEDQKAGKLDTQSTPEQKSTSVEKQESVMLSDQAKRIQKASKDMAQSPVVDMERVNAVKLKLAQGIDILGDKETAQASSLKIAEKMLSLEAELNQLTHDD